MPLPPDFRDLEHLQDIVRREHNRAVDRWFRQQPDNDISTSKSSMKQACKIKDEDNVLIMLQRQWLFEVVCRHARSLQTPIYGMPASDCQIAFRFKPQIGLYFSEDLADVEEGYPAITGEISFRVMNKESSIISRSDLEMWANRIRSSFASGNGFVWRKGKILITYTDNERGYRLKLLCRDKTEGKRLIESALDVQGHSPEWRRMNIKENEEPTASYPIIPNRINVLGRSQRLPRRRPIADVRFAYAYLHLWGKTEPVALVDRTGFLSAPVIAVA